MHWGLAEFSQRVLEQIQTGTLVWFGTAVL
jgi:hypothetical protein